jgi:hypothetical protein
MDRLMDFALSTVILTLCAILLLTFGALGYALIRTIMGACLW